MLWNILQIVLAYVAADAVSGVYHFATDKGFNLAFQVREFQNHHDHPATMTFDLRTGVFGIPCLVLAWFVAPWFWCSMAFFMLVMQVPHYYTHHPKPALFAWLQALGLVLTPKHHGGHHRGDHNRNYCILSGWNDFWLNTILW